MTVLRRSCLLMLFTMIGLTCTAQGAIITMIHSGAGSGSIDGNSFDSSFTITAVGNTDNRVTLGTDAYSIQHISAEITIGGMGTFDFVSATRTFSAAGVGFGSNDADLFSGPSDSLLDTWDMLSSIGPVSGVAALLQWTLFDVETSGGILVFDDLQTTGTFEAIVEGDGGGSQVPEPASLAAWGMSALACLAWRIGKRHKTN